MQPLFKPLDKYFLYSFNKKTQKRLIGDIKTPLVAEQIGFDQFFLGKRKGYIALEPIESILLGGTGHDYHMIIAFDKRNIFTHRRAKQPFYPVPHDGAAVFFTDGISYFKFFCGNAYEHKGLTVKLFALLKRPIEIAPLF